MSRIVCEPPEGSAYPRIVFDSDDERKTLSVLIGDNAITGLSWEDIAALYSALKQVIGHDYNDPASQPRDAEPGPAIPPE